MHTEKHQVSGFVISMVKIFRLKFLLIYFSGAFILQSYAAEAKPADTLSTFSNQLVIARDTTLPSDIMELITTVINSSNTFNIDAVANLYTPNAVISDDEPPYSWNGPTAGVQWVNAIEKACKDNHVTKLKGTIGAINVFQQSTDNVYVVVPVAYTGLLPGKQRFAVKGAFTFVLRKMNDKWQVKSQTWIQQKAINGD